MAEDANIGGYAFLHSGYKQCFQPLYWSVDLVQFVMTSPATTFHSYSTVQTKSNSNLAATQRLESVPPCKSASTVVKPREHAFLRIQLQWNKSTYHQNNIVWNPTPLQSGSPVLPLQKKNLHMWDKKWLAPSNMAYTILLASPSSYRKRLPCGQAP